MVLDSIITFYRRLDATITHIYEEHLPLAIYIIFYSFYQMITSLYDEEVVMVNSERNSNYYYYIQYNNYTIYYLS